MKQGIYIRHEDLERRLICQLLVEAAFLLDQHFPGAQAEAQIACGLAFLKMVELADQETRSLIQSMLATKMGAQP